MKLTYTPRLGPTLVAPKDMEVGEIGIIVHESHTASYTGLIVQRVLSCPWFSDECLVNLDKNGKPDSYWDESIFAKPIEQFCIEVER